MEWIESTGRGSVYSFSVVHRVPSAEFGAPYVVALVDLDEAGVRLLTNVVGCEPAEVRIGARVEVCFESRGEEAVPVFQLER